MQFIPVFCSVDVLMSEMTNGEKSLHSIAMYVLFGILVCIGLEVAGIYYQFQKYKTEIDLLQTQKQTALKERERYEYQIQLIARELENEKLRNETYRKLR